MNMSLHLFVQVYKPALHDHLQRMLERITSNASNASISFIQAITVFSEGVAVEAANDRVRVVPISEPIAFAFSCLRPMESLPKLSNYSS